MVGKCFFFNDTATTEIYTLSLHDALPICNVDKVKYNDLGAGPAKGDMPSGPPATDPICIEARSEEHTSELQSHSDLVCRLLLEKKKDLNNFFFLDTIFCTP